MKRTLTLAFAVAILATTGAAPAAAFCGFFVAKADTKLFNKASQVVLVRDGDRTVITMSNDFQGDPKEFAMVVPVPTFIQREQIHVGDRAVLEHLDAYTAPRLVEYQDPDPCQMTAYDRMEMKAGQVPMPASAAGMARAQSLGVKIEAQYTVGEYDILILSAQQSDGLERWLRESGYRIPTGASAILGSYLKQNMRFFVAKVNLSEQAKLGFHYLRPLAVAYESPKFMLPIRLGTVNADGPQELFVYALTRQGRVESTNYRTVRLPTGATIPEYVRGEFGDFYRAMFAKQTRDADMRAVFLEYAWDMSWCDPCAADPLSSAELRELGVFWLGEPTPMDSRAPAFRPMPVPPGPGGAVDTFVTRLHVRYDAAHFPEDLVFQTTGDRQSFQGRYVLQHPFAGAMECDAGRRYRESLTPRREQEARTLANLTGWELASIRTKMQLDGGDAKPADRPWYETIWRD
ncbi:MAG: DUF2330 domain-containing protein [bacterium]